MSDDREDDPSRLFDRVTILMVHAKVQYLPISPNAAEDRNSPDADYDFTAF